MRGIKTILALLLALALLLPLAPAARAEDGDILSDPRFAGKTWEEVMDEFFTAHQTNTAKVACGWKNTVTGEEHYINGDQYMVSGSMYKVPMNMIFAERVYNGQITWDTFVGAYKYDYALRATIVDSNNDVARSMWEYLGGYQPYRHLLAPYMGEDPDTVDEKFYENNFSTPRQMIYALNLLATESERFPRVIDTMLQAEPNKYFKIHTHDIDIAHKYGYYAEGTHLYLNDCAILFTEEPACIVIFTDTVIEPYAVLADYCDLMCDWTKYSTAARKEEERIAAEQAAIAALATPTPVPEIVQPTSPDAPAPTEGTAPAPTPAPAEDDGVSVFGGVILPLLLALAVAALALLALMAALQRARRGKLNLPWALAAVLLTAAALWLCILPQRESASAPASAAVAASVREGEPQETVAAFFDALIAGDYETAYAQLSGVSTLGLEKPPASEDAAALYDALRAGWGYKLYGESRETATGAVQQLLFSTRDFAAMRAAVKEKTDSKVAQLAAELPQDEIYDEAGAYLDSFTQRAYSEALQEVLEHAADYDSLVGLNINLEYADGKWLIVPDGALYSALTGGALQGKGA